MKIRRDPRIFEDIDNPETDIYIGIKRIRGRGLWLKIKVIFKFVLFLTIVIIDTIGLWVYLKLKKLFTGSYGEP